MARKKVPQNLEPETAPAANAKAGFDSAAAPAAYQDETLEAKAANAARTGVIEDEWYGEISSGDPFYEIARPYIEANPDKHFRWLSDPHCQRRTKRGYQDVYDKTGKVVECAGSRLGWIPRHEYERREKARADRATSALKISKETYQEAENKALRDSGGSISMLPHEDERFVGNRRVSV